MQGLERIALNDRSASLQKGCPIAWLVFLVAIALAAVLAIVINLNRMVFERRLSSEMRGLLAVPPSAVPRPGVANLVAIFRRPLHATARLPLRSVRWCRRCGCIMAPRFA
jgi:hypothetical protein